MKVNCSQRVQQEGVCLFSDWFTHATVYLYMQLNVSRLQKLIILISRRNMSTPEQLLQIVRAGGTGTAGLSKASATSCRVCFMSFIVYLFICAAFRQKVSFREPPWMPRRPPGSWRRPQTSLSGRRSGTSRSAVQSFLPTSNKDQGNIYQLKQWATVR